MFNGTIVAKMNDQKHLGLSLDSSLSFKKHVNEKINKAKKNLGLIKHLPMFLPHKTLDLMYKALVRSHFVYCGMIYHIPSKQTQIGVTLNALMEKLKEFNTKQPLLLPVHGGKVYVVQSFMRNWGGNHYLVVIGVGAFCKYIRL